MMLKSLIVGGILAESSVSALRLYSAYKPWKHYKSREKAVWGVDDSALQLSLQLFNKEKQRRPQNTDSSAKNLFGLEKKLPKPEESAPHSDIHASSKEPKSALPMGSNKKEFQYVELTDEKMPFKFHKFEGKSHPYWDELGRKWYRTLEQFYAGKNCPMGFRKLVDDETGKTYYYDVDRRPKMKRWDSIQKAQAKYTERASPFVMMHVYLRGEYFYTLFPEIGSSYSDLKNELLTEPGLKNALEMEAGKSIDAQSLILNFGEKIEIDGLEGPQKFFHSEGRFEFEHRFIPELIKKGNFAHVGKVLHDSDVIESKSLSVPIDIDFVETREAPLVHVTIPVYWGNVGKDFELLNVYTLKVKESANEGLIKNHAFELLQHGVREDFEIELILEQTACYKGKKILSPNEQYVPSVQMSTDENEEMRKKFLKSVQPLYRSVSVERTAIEVKDTTHITEEHHNVPFIFVTDPTFADWKAEEPILEDNEEITYSEDSLTTEEAIRKAQAVRERCGMREDFSNEAIAVERRRRRMEEEAERKRMEEEQEIREKMRKAEAGRQEEMRKQAEMEEQAENKRRAEKKKAAIQLGTRLANEKRKAEEQELEKQKLAAEQALKKAQRDEFLKTIPFFPKFKNEYADSAPNPFDDEPPATISDDDSEVAAIGGSTADADYVDAEMETHQFALLGQSLATHSDTGNSNVDQSIAAKSTMLGKKITSESTTADMSNSKKSKSKKKKRNFLKCCGRNNFE